MKKPEQIETPYPEMEKEEYDKIIALNNERVVLKAEGFDLSEQFKKNDAVYQQILLQREAITKREEEIRASIAEKQAKCEEIFNDTLKKNGLEGEYHVMVEEPHYLLTKEQLEVFKNETK